MQLNKKNSVVEKENDGEFDKVVSVGKEQMDVDVVNESSVVEKVKECEEAVAKKGRGRPSKVVDESRKKKKVNEDVDDASVIEKLNDGELNKAVEENDVVVSQQSIVVVNEATGVEKVKDGSKVAARKGRGRPPKGVDESQKNENIAVIKPTVVIKPR
jgi:hypothetical protein